MNEREVITFFRLGLATGLVDKQSVIAWADQALLSSPIPSEAVIELSLSGRLPHSQLVRLLATFQGNPDYDLPLNLLFAQAGSCLEERPTQAAVILQALCLVNAEEYLPAGDRRRLSDLAHCLEQHQQGRLSLDALHVELSGFLAGYHAYRAAVRLLI